MTSATPSQVTNNTLLLNGAGGSSATMQTSNNNRSSGSTGTTNGVSNGLPASRTKRGGSGGGTVRKGSVSGSSFKMLDTAIVNLDASFETLPDKTPWAAYAAAIEGEWQLCANCMPDGGAKKLYRQYNFNRQRISLPVVSTPTDDTEVCDAFLIGFRYDGTGGGLLCSWECSPPPLQDFWCVASVGKSLTNPLIFLPKADNAVDQPGVTPLSVWLENVGKLIGIKFIGLEGTLSTAVCVFTVNGAPGLREFPQMVWVDD